MAKKIIVDIPSIPSPSVEEVRKYMKKWDSLENYRLQAQSLQKLFTKTYPKNIDIDDVLIKVSSLNDFYSTNIRSPFAVAKHIVDLKIDQRLANKDLTLINNIAKVNITTKAGEDKIINFYSFATKYCSNHFPEDYPIYDSFADKMLRHFMCVDKFYKFKKDDLRCYKKYHEVFMNFVNKYNLKEFSIRDIDKYLWLAGKEYFPRKNK